MGTIEDISEEHGVTVSTAITAPWKSASIFAKSFQGDAAEAFTNSGMAANVFSVTSSAAIAGVEATAKGYVTSILTALASPWKTMTGAGSPIATFSTSAEGAIDGALTEAQSNATAMTSSLKQPWVDATGAINTYSTTAKNALDGVVKKAEEAAKAINAANNVPTPSYDTNKTSTNNTNTNNTNTNTNKTVSSADIKALQEILNDAFFVNIAEDGKLGSETEKAIKSAQNTMIPYLKQKGYKGTLPTADGKYGKITRAAMEAYFQYKIDDMIANSGGSSMVGTGVRWYREYIQKLPAAFYAKGTTGTTTDQWAYTDEPWLGDELTMYATKQGTLSYMRAGSTVIPADLTKELMAIGEFGLDGLTDLQKFESGVNLMNYVSKPELNISFDSMVHVDHCDEGTLKSLEKMVDAKIDQFSKQMNYAIARYK